MRSRSLPWIVLAAVALLGASYLAFRESSRDAARSAPRTAPLDRAAPPVPAPVASVRDEEATESRVAVEPSVLPDSETASEPSLAAKDAEAESAMLSLRVVDEETRLPVRGARVGLWRPSADGSSAGTGWIFGEEDLRARTGANGRATLRAMARVPLKLRIVRPKGSVGPDVDREVEALAPGELRELVVDLPAPRETAFWGRAIDRDSGLPIADALIPFHSRSQLDREWRSAPDDPVHSLRSDGSGFFRVSVPAWEQFWIRVEAAGYSTRVARIGEGHESTDRARTIRLLRGATLRASVASASGSPVSDVQVWIWTDGYRLDDSSLGDRVFETVEWMGVTDARGLCTIDGLPADAPLEIEARAWLRSKREPTSIRLSAGETRLWSCVLGGGGALSGQIVDQHGAPVARSQVWLVPRGKLPGGDLAMFPSSTHDVIVGSTLTDAEGKFRIEDVDPGDYWVGPAERYPSEPTAESVCSAGIPVTMPAGADREVTVPAWRALFVEGRVVDPWSIGLPGIRVSAHCEGGPIGRDATSAAEGRFRLGPVPPGEVTLHASVWREGLVRGAPVVARAGETGLLLRLERGASLSGRVVDGQSGAPIRVDIHVLGSDGASGSFGRSDPQDGRFEFHGLGAGTYRVVARAPDGRAGYCDNLVLSTGQALGGVEVRIPP